MNKKVKWVGTLSTTERNNIGLIQVRQNNVNSETLGFNIVDGNGEPYDLKNRKVLFCTYFDKFSPVEQYAEVIENGKIVYTMNEHDMQKPVRINFAYFKIMDEKDNLVDTTQNFSYDIMPSIESKCGDFGAYIIRLEEVLDAFLQINSDAKKELEQIIMDFNDQVIKQQQDFEFWFESIRDILESIDPGGILLSEIVDFRYSKMLDKHFSKIKDRGDFWDDEIALRKGVSLAWFEDKQELTAFKQAIDFAKAKKIPYVFIPPGEFKSNNEFVPKEIKIFGSGSGVSILKSDEGKSGISVESRNSFAMQGVTLEGHYDTDFVFETVGLELNGAAASTLLLDVTVRKYKTLLLIKNSLFSSSFINLRLLQGETHIMIREGFNVVLNFYNLYSNQAYKTHIDGQKCLLNFFGGNFGGLINSDKTQKFATIDSDFSTNFYGVNFESIKIADLEESLLFKGKQKVTFDSCTHQIVKTKNNAEGFLIKAKDNVKLKITNPSFLNYNEAKIKPVAAENNVILDMGESDTTYVISDMINKKTSVKGFRRYTKESNPLVLGNTSDSREILIYPSINYIIRRIIIYALRDVSSETNMPRITMTQGSTTFLDMKVPAMKTGESKIIKDEELTSNFVKEWEGPLILFSENNKKYADKDTISVGIEYFIV